VPSHYPAPSEKVVQSLLDRIATTPMHVALLANVGPQREPTGIIFEYVSDGDVPAAIAFCDHDAVNFVGGAIASVDVETIRGTHHKPTLNEAAVDGFREVANGLGAALNGEYTPVVRLADVHRLPGSLSDTIKELWRYPAAKRAYRLTVDDYGAGTVILCLA
jgi:hypothetical protein